MSATISAYHLAWMVTVCRAWPRFAHGLVEGLAGFVIRWLESLDKLGLVNLSLIASPLSYMLIAGRASKGYA
jgi:hypothetical protein